MPRLNISNEDLLRGKILPPGRYHVHVKSLEEKTDKDNAGLYVYKLIVEDHEKFNGVPLRFQVSEKAPGMATPLLVACGWKASAGVIELNDAVNKHLDCFVQRGEYRGKPTNEVVDFFVRERPAAVPA